MTAFAGRTGLIRFQASDKNAPFGAFLFIYEDFYIH